MNTRKIHTRNTHHKEDPMKNQWIKKIALTLALALGFVILLSSLMSAGALATDGYQRALALGMEGEDVKALQQRLKDLDYYQGPVNGTFDEATQEALAAFQAQNKLLASGILDRITYLLLFSEEALESVGLDSRMDLTLEGIAPGTVHYASPMFDSLPLNTNEYSFFNENRFLSVLSSPLCTFAADVDTASYGQLRAKILAGEAVPPDSVRIEEMLNYFRYDYQGPKEGEPFGITYELAQTPWNKDSLLLLIGLQAREIPREERPRQNLVFLIDVSGSMDMPDKLPLVKRSFLLLLEEMDPKDTISIVTYASRDEVLLAGVPAGEKTRIMEAIEQLTAGGYTAGEAGINKAYELAREYYIQGGNNRILLATDGDLNVGVSDEGSLVRLVTKQKEGGIFLSVLGFGDGNYKDNKLEALADHGDGNYHFIDTIYEARKALVEEIGATFFAVAKDVKLQVDFNPAYIKGYRLIGYENRLMDAEDFADDKKDGGELGSGHRVTVLFELVPVDSPFEIPETGSKYQTPAQTGDPGDELLTLSLRAKTPEGEESTLYSYPLLKDQPRALTPNLRFAAAVAQTGMLLRDSEWQGTATHDSTLALLREDADVTGDPYKEEFLYLVNLLARAEQGK